MSPNKKQLQQETKTQQQEDMTQETWRTMNQRIWTLLGALLLSSVLGLVIYSHWVYFGCEISKGTEPSRMAMLKDMLSSGCPATDLLPKTPLQRIALSVLPYSDSVAKYSYGMACKRSVLGSTTAICESLFALSYLSAIIEWGFYLYVIMKLIHNFIVKPIFGKLLTIFLILGVGLFVGKFAECYATSLFGNDVAPKIVYWAQITNRVICEFAAFVCGVCLTVFHSIRRMILMDPYPGASLWQSVQTAFPFLSTTLWDLKERVVLHTRMAAATM